MNRTRHFRVTFRTYGFRNRYHVIHRWKDHAVYYTYTNCHILWAFMFENTIKWKKYLLDAGCTFFSLRAKLIHFQIAYIYEKHTNACLLLFYSRNKKQNVNPFKIEQMRTFFLMIPLRALPGCERASGNTLIAQRQNLRMTIIYTRFSQKCMFLLFLFDKNI